MNKKIEAEFIISKENNLLFWMFQLSWVVIAYNIVKIAIPLVDYTCGGYYLYNIFALEFVLGIFLPIFFGAILGGGDYGYAIIEYKLTNESKKEFLQSKIYFLMIGIILYLILSTGVGLCLDGIAQTFSGNFSSNLLIILQRFGGITLIWFLWGMISFFFSNLLKNTAISITLCILFYYAEQYITQYLPEKISKYGVVWNQKSVLIHLFSDKNIPFGIVQSAYNPSILSFFFLVLVICFCILGCFCIMKKQDIKTLKLFLQIKIKNQIMKI